MAFTLLNKRILADEDIKDRVLDIIHNTTFNNKIDIIGNSSAGSSFLLADYDMVSKSSIFIERKYMIKNNTSEINYDRKIDSIYDYYYSILPIVDYSEIKKNSEVIDENDNTITIKCGRGKVSNIPDSDAIRKIEREYSMGDFIKTDQKLTIALDKNGEKIKVSIYKNKETGEEYVFLKRDNFDQLDDSFDIDASIIGIVSDLKWIVDKKTNIAICTSRAFLSQSLYGKYEDSKLAEYLQSDEFLKDFRITKEKKQEKKHFFNLENDKKINLEQTIKELLSIKAIPYLHGHPGVGKSQIAESVNKNCLRYNISTFTPNILTGESYVKNGDEVTSKNEDGSVIRHYNESTTMRAMPKWYLDVLEMSKTCFENGERCILLFDEFDKMLPSMQVFFNGLDNSEKRIIAGWEIPENVDIILTGNTPEYSSASFEITGEVKSRYANVEVEVDVNSWLKWASKNDIDPLIRAYIYNNQNSLLYDVLDKDGGYNGEISLSPRRWGQDINELIKKARNGEVNISLLKYYMEEKKLKDFIDFSNTYFEIEIESILYGKNSSMMTMTDDVIQVIINSLIAITTTEEELENVLLFIKNTNINEYMSFFKNSWLRLNDTSEDIIKMRNAEADIEERGIKHGF